MKNKFKLFFTLFFAVWLQSCSQDPAADYPTYNDYQVPNSAKKVVMLSSYSYQQTTAYTCAPAVIMNLLHYYGKLSNAQMNRSTELRIASEMHTTSDNGTSQENMVAWLENHGFDVQYGDNASTNMIINNLNHRIPTIIVWNDWSGHAVLVVGYVAANTAANSGNDTMFIANPSTTSFVVQNNHDYSGIDTLTQNQINLNWVNAKYFFNPSHTKTGMYIVAVPK